MFLDVNGGSNRAPRPKRRKWIIGAVLVASISGAILVWKYFPAFVVHTHAVFVGEKSVPASHNEAQTISDRGTTPADIPSVDSATHPADAEAAALATFRSFLRGVEKRNAHLYWSKRFGNGTQMAIAVSPPNLDDIAAISGEFSTSLEQVPEGKRAQAREALQKLYDHYLWFPQKFRIYMVFLNDDRARTVVNSFTSDSLQSATPGDDGSVNFGRGVKISRGTKALERYGYLLED